MPPVANMANPLDTDAGAEQFDSYEAELQLVEADLTQKLDQVDELTGEERKAAVRGAQRAAEEAKELVCLHQNLSSPPASMRQPSIPPLTTSPARTNEPLQILHPHHPTHQNQHTLPQRAIRPRRPHAPSQDCCQLHLRPRATLRLRTLHRRPL